MFEITTAAAAQDIRARQCASWERGEHAPLEEFLKEHHDLADDDVLDLIYSEILLREEFGETVERADFERRFPNHAPALARLLDLHGAIESIQAGETLVDEPRRQAVQGLAVRPAQIGNYDIIAELGHGGMGVVYQGQHRLLSERIAAIKVIRPELISMGAPDQGPSQLERIRTEANAAARLHHENIVPVYEFGAYATSPGGDELPYVAFEFVAGGSLAQKIAGNPLSPRDAAQMLLPLAQAMDYAHREGIIHRDLKPANVLLQIADCRLKIEEGKPSSQSAICNLQSAIPKIADFGLAKQLDADCSQTRAGAILGTPSYMAPEQARGQTLQQGPAVDIYALGAILYEMLTGRPPFRADTVLHTLEQVATHEPVPPTRLQPTVPRDLETICLKCLRKEPAQRYASAGALAEDVRRFLAGEPIHARPASFVERCVKWLRRRPAAAALLGVTLLSVLGMAVLWLSFTLRLQSERDYAKDQKTKADNERQIAQHERDEARKQSERAASILRHALFTVEAFAKNTRAAAGTDTETGTGALLFQLACSYGRTSSSLAQDEALLPKDRAELAEQYAANAVRLLGCAETVGYFQPPRRAQREALLKNADLQVVREREDYQQLLRRLGLAAAASN